MAAAALLRGFCEHPSLGGLRCLDTSRRPAVSYVPNPVTVAASSVMSLMAIRDNLALALREES